MTFLDCPARLDQEGAVRCGLPAAHRPNSASAYYLGHPARLWIMGDPDTAATGAVMRPATLRRYAAKPASATWRSCRSRRKMLRFYRLTP